MSRQHTEGVELPIPIDDSETIVRAIVAPAHYKKGKVATAVFRPRAGESAVSVMRQFMGDDFCKAKGVEIGNTAPSQTYVGLLTIKAVAIRAEGSTVTDSRDQWLGHADLDHGFPSAPPNDPASAAEFKRMTERCQALKKTITFHADLAPNDEGWCGPSLKIE